VEQRDEGFLPPEPSGPEPDVGGGRQEQQPAGQQPPGQQPGTQQQPAYQQPPPAYQPPPGYRPPPGYPPPAQPGWQQQAPGYYGWAPPPPPQPDNGPAVAGFVLSMVAAGLWLFSAGLSSVVSIVCAVLGVIYSRRGKQKVEAGETQKHKDLAQVGFIMGWIMVGLAALSTIAWILIFVLAATSESFNDNMQQELDDSQTSGGLRVGLAAVRVGVLLLC
jgi:hypothetical protein